MYILYMLVLNNTPFVHSRGYLQYLNSALPGGQTRLKVNINKVIKEVLKLYSRVSG